MGEISTLNYNLICLDVDEGVFMKIGNILISKCFHILTSATSANILN